MAADLTESAKPQTDLPRWNAYIGLAACGYSLLVWTSYKLSLWPATSHLMLAGYLYVLSLLAFVLLPTVFLTCLCFWIACISDRQKRGWVGALLALVAIFLYIAMIVSGDDQAQRDRLGGGPSRRGQERYYKNHHR